MDLFSGDQGGKRLIEDESREIILIDNKEINFLGDESHRGPV